MERVPLDSRVLESFGSYKHSAPAEPWLAVTLAVNIAPVPISNLSPPKERYSQETR